jgi:hypothetical protein
MGCKDGHGHYLNPCHEVVRDKVEEVLDINSISNENIKFCYSKKKKGRNYSC